MPNTNNTQLGGGVTQTNIANTAAPQYNTFIDADGVQYTTDSLLFGIINTTTISAGGGFFSSTFNGSWVSAVESMGKWYEQNIHTYQGTTAKPRKGKTWYFCPLVNTKVADDCSGFVQACLMLFGVKCPTICTADMNKSPFMQLMESAGFQHSSGMWTPENTIPGDILCGGPQTHTEIYAGNRKSWGWGNIHDGQNGHAAMPAPFCKIDSRGGYIHCWRKS